MTAPPPAPVCCLVGKVSPLQWVLTGKRRVTASAEVRACAAEQALFEGDEEGRTLATLVLDSLRRWGPL